MACEQNQLLSPLIDGELSASQRKSLERHIETCGECAIELASLRRASALFAAQSPANSIVGNINAATGGFLARVSDSVSREWQQGPAVARLRDESDLMRIARRLSAAAACLLAAGSLWVWHSGALSERPAPQPAAVVAEQSSNWDSHFIALPPDGASSDGIPEVVSSDLQSPAWMMNDLSR